MCKKELPVCAPRKSIHIHGRKATHTFSRGRHRHRLRPPSSLWLHFLSKHDHLTSSHLTSNKLKGAKKKEHCMGDTRSNALYIFPSSLSLHLSIHSSPHHIISSSSKSLNHSPHPTPPSPNTTLYQRYWNDHLFFLLFPNTAARHAYTVPLPHRSLCIFHVPQNHYYRPQTRQREISSCLF